MNRQLQAILLIALLVCLPGCYDRMDLENATLSLMIGLDLDEKNNLLVYMSSPVFSKEAKKKMEEFGVKSSTVRQARSRLDSMVTAMTVSGKVQVILLGERLLQHEDWFPLMDVIFRDAKFTVNAKMVAVEGRVADVITYAPEDKPRLALHLSKLIDTANERNVTIKTTAQEFHRQMYEKGMTPSITGLKKRKELELTGVALLTEKGKYAATLSIEEAKLLNLLRFGKKEDMTLTIPIPGPEQAGGEGWSPPARPRDALPVLRAVLIPV